MTACAIIRVDDFTLYKVTTSGTKQALREFITGEKYLYIIQCNFIITFAYVFFIIAQHKRREKNVGTAGILFIP